MEAKEILESMVYSRTEVDNWFAGRICPFSKYDSELGYLLRSARFKDGVDGSISTYTYDDYGFGPRRMIAYADKLCRINTYGDSFTECHQVSDGETWQEILAAHLCEPLRNFGVGGYSVYQAYLRMKREEKQTPAEYIIFNIYDDDHYRNLDGWRIRKSPSVQPLTFHMYPTVPYVKVNLKTGEFAECANLCPTPESFYNLCDLDWVFETFKDDFVLKIMLARANVREGNPERSYADIMNLAARNGIETQIDSCEKLAEIVDKLYNKAAIFASMRIVEKVEEFATSNGKKVLYVLSFMNKSIARRVKQGYRFDQEFVDFLDDKKLPYVDLMKVHVSEFTQFRKSIEDYLDKYYIGHYNPLGNFFQAFAIRDKLVKILNPRPTPYQGTIG